MSRWRRAVLVLGTIPIALGVWLAVGSLRAPHGYAAAYGFGAAWVTAIALALAGTLFLALRPTRRAGAAVIVAALAFLASFYAVYGIGVRLGLHAWKHKVVQTYTRLPDGRVIEHTTIDSSDVSDTDPPTP